MKNKNFLILFILILFITPNLSALGITPGRTIIDFSPNLEKEIQFTIFNSQNKDMNVAFVIKGELEKIVKLKEKVVHFNSSENSKLFKYKFKLPPKLDSGLHKIDISAIEIPEYIGEELLIKSTVSVVTQIYIYVPYPGKYVKTEMKSSNFKSW